MKHLLLILSLLLSFLAEERETVKQEQVCPVNTENSIAEGQLNNRDICLTAATGLCFSGENTTGQFSVRAQQTLRRTPQNLRSGVKLIKSGKALDNNTFSHQQAVDALLASHCITGRYIYSIRNLRL